MARLKVKKPPVITIVGPTASGKTAVSLLLAGRHDSEIISADSRQIYRYLDIGTAKPTQSELEGCKHHFIDTLLPSEQYSAGKFAQESLEVLLDIVQRNKLPIIVGGSGLYIRALCEGIFREGDQNTTKIRAELDERLATEGKELLYKELHSIDPESASLYSDMNPRRIIRALEYFYANGIPFSRAHKDNPTPDIPFIPHYFGIDLSRDELYRRINERCEIMWNQGLLQETEQILKMGYHEGLNALNTVGYKEAIQYIQGRITATDALKAMQQSTRRYAKRQLTWFRSNTAIQWLHGSTEAIADQIETYISQLQS